MNIIKIIFKSLNFILIFFFLILIFLTIFIANVDDYSIKHERKNFRNIIKSGTIRENLLNDYNEVFLPKTQYQKFNYKKINLSFLNPEESTFLYSRHYTFFIEEKDKEIFFITQKGSMYFINKNDLDSEKINFRNINTNLNNVRVLDMKIYNNKISISFLVKKK